MLISRLELDVPITLYADLSVLNEEPVPWFEFEEIAKQSCRARHIKISQKAVDHRRVNFAAHRGVDQDRLHLRSKAEEVLTQIVVEGLDPNPVPRQKQRLLIGIPNGKSEHAAKLLEAIAAVLFIQMDDHLSVRLGFENMAFGEKQRAEFLVIVNFAIKNDPNGAVFVGKRLVPPAQIDNRKASETQSDRAFHVIPFVVRAAMNDRVRHLFHQIR